MREVVQDYFAFVEQRETDALASEMRKEGWFRFLVWWKGERKVGLEGKGDAGGTRWNGLRGVYIMSNGDRAWLEAVRAALKEDALSGWEVVLGDGEVRVGGALRVLFLFFILPSGLYFDSSDSLTISTLGLGRDSNQQGPPARMGREIRSAGARYVCRAEGGGIHWKRGAFNSSLLSPLIFNILPSPCSCDFFSQFSSLTSNVVMLRKFVGLHPVQTRFW